MSHGQEKHDRLQDRDDNLKLEFTIKDWQFVLTKTKYNMIRKYKGWNKMPPKGEYGQLIGN